MRETETDKHTRMKRKGAGFLSEYIQHVVAEMSWHLPDVTCKI